MFVTPKLNLNVKLTGVRLLGVLLVVACWLVLTESGIGQDSQPSDAAPAIERPNPEAGSSNSSGSKDSSGSQGISMLSLLFKGGWFMLPLLGLSVLIIVITVERIISLRAEKTMPSELVGALGKLSTQSEGFDPRSAYKICQAHPSVASTVVQAMLLKVGRPVSEVEATVSDASQREADRLQRPIRWLELAAAIAPLVGLLGTVWGVTQAFYEMTQLTVGQNKAEALAAGIYTALITTISGLIIAIPALVMYKGLESQIEKLFHRIDELMMNLIPQIERFEGQIRFADPAHGSVSSGSSKSSKSSKKSGTGSRSDSSVTERISS